MPYDKAVAIAKNPIRLRSRGRRILKIKNAVTIKEIIAKISPPPKMAVNPVPNRHCTSDIAPVVKQSNIVVQTILFTS
jgi:hypothetical protein